MDAASRGLERRRPIVRAGYLGRNGQGFFGCEAAAWNTTRRL